MSPYKNPKKQREAVNRAVKRHNDRVKKARKEGRAVYPRRAGRPLGSLTYDTPEMLVLAIAKQERRLVDLEKKRDGFQYTSKEYKNHVSYMSETRNRIAKLRLQLETLNDSIAKRQGIKPDDAPQ